MKHTKKILYPSWKKKRLQILKYDKLTSRLHVSIGDNSLHLLLFNYNDRDNKATYVVKGMTGELFLISKMVIKYQKMPNG